MERIFAKSTLREYWEKVPETEQHLKTWYDTVKSVQWKTPSDVKKSYANASILKNGRIVSCFPYFFLVRKQIFR